jgi:hypothetical protein
MDNNSLKIDIVNENEMPSSAKDLDYEPSVDAIPDLELLTKNINEITDYLEKPSSQLLLKENPSVIKRLLNEKYLNVPYGILVLLLERDTPEIIYDNGMLLLKMIETLKKAKTGEMTIHDASVSFSDVIKQKYKVTKEDIERELLTSAKIGKNIVKN